MVMVVIGEGLVSEFCDCINVLNLLLSKDTIVFSTVFLVENMSFFDFFVKKIIAFVEN